MDENGVIKTCCVMRKALNYLHIMHFDTHSRQSRMILFARHSHPHSHFFCVNFAIVQNFGEMVEFINYKI